MGDQSQHLLVRRRVEMLVPQSDRLEIVTRLEADHLVGDLLESLGTVGGAHRNGEDQTSGPLLAQGLQSSLGRDSCCQAVVDQYDVAPLYRG
jgi:hypothetical protein